MGSIRREVIVDRPAESVWAVLRDPSSIARWFPGIVEATVDGSARVITTASGIPMPEEIITNDSLQRRFQYRITAPIVRNHLGTIDVFALDDRSCLVSYSTDCEPDAVALIIGGAAGNALLELRRQVEAGDRPAPSADEHSVHEGARAP